MSRKLIVTALILGLVAALAAPALGKKKKSPKPYKSEQVTIHAGHPAFFTTSGTLVTLTAQEFFASCALPSSNGFDAYVFEVPAAYRKISSAITATGSGPAGYDLDIYLYDKSCSNVGAFNAEGTDESGVLSPGTAFILIHNYLGPEATAQFELKPIK